MGFSLPRVDYLTLTLIYLAKDISWLVEINRTLTTKKTTQFLPTSLLIKIKKIYTLDLTRPFSTALFFTLETILHFFTIRNVSQ